MDTYRNGRLALLVALASLIIAITTLFPYSRAAAVLWLVRGLAVDYVRYGDGFESFNAEL